MVSALTFRRLCPPLILRSAPFVLVFILGSISVLLAQSQPRSDSSALYQQLQNPSVIEKSAHLENVVLRRDRVTITFTNGIVYFSPLVAGKVCSAVFVGSESCKPRRHRLRSN